MSKEQAYRKLVEDFAEAAEKSFEATQNGNWADNNRWVKKQVAVFRYIIELGTPARDELLEFLNHENPVVAKSAATFSLKYATERSIAVLQQIANEPGLLGFEAQQSLFRWHEGNWQLE